MYTMIGIILNATSNGLAPTSINATDSITVASTQTLSPDNYWMDQSSNLYGNFSLQNCSFRADVLSTVGYVVADSASAEEI
jgi:hypothetical protein